LPHEITAAILSYEGGISVRSGCFCAQPYVQKLLKLCDADIKSRIKNSSLHHPGMVRISFGLYNSNSEIDILIQLLRYIAKNKDGYLKKYKNLAVSHY
ncbi:MAG: aminotransferase class V-fold PLP-dependent enzyme, partial [Alkaliphilus sp.]|nr:aminotransferase class V-fold PLP-dependent enzyme [Alkaliphilus sp.]